MLAPMARNAGECGWEPGGRPSTFIAPTVAQPPLISPPRCPLALCTRAPLCDAAGVFCVKSVYVHVHIQPSFNMWHVVMTSDDIRHHTKHTHVTTPCAHAHILSLVPAAGRIFFFSRQYFIFIVVTASLLTSNLYPFTHAHPRRSQKGKRLRVVKWLLWPINNCDCGKKTAVVQ